MSRTRRLVIALLVLLVIIAAAIVPGKIHLNRQRARLASVLSAELGREVTLGTISLRLLPRPGFDITNGFSVADDPAFSAEPMLRAEEVAADLRLSSLWGGRIEIAQIKLTGASMNVVRRADRHWNLESLLLRASQIPSAPTPHRHAEARPRFPYIEATDSRINVKFGNEKSAYALTEADFSGWLENDDHWNLRLQARPLRTDIPVSDTGTIRINARAGRASRLADTPIEATVSLQQAQLGELTKLVLGHDLAWRGSMETQWTARGPLAHLRLASSVHISEFRRYDVASDTSFELRAACSAFLNSAPGVRSLDGIACDLPLGGATAAIAVHGSATVKSGRPAFTLNVQARDVPAEQLARVYRNAKQYVAPDLTAAGNVNGEIMVARSAAAPVAISGDAVLTGFSLSSPALAVRILSSGPVRFSSALPPAPVPKHRRAVPTVAPGPVLPAGIRLLPVALTQLGDATGNFGAAGWQLQLASDFDVPYALSIGRALGFTVPFSVSRGHATGPLTISGRWIGFAPYALTSDLTLTGVVAGDAARALHIDTAKLRLSPEAAQLYGMHARFPAAALAFDGSIAVARPCIVAEDCTYTAELHSASLDVAKLQPLFADDAGILGSIFQRGSWLDRNQKLLASVNASGTLRIDHLGARTVAADALVSTFRLHDGTLIVQNLSASAYGGKVNAATLRATFIPAPSYAIAAQLQRINAAKLASTLGATGLTGTLSGALQLRMEGDSRSALAKSAAGNAEVAILNGSIEAGSDLFRFKQLTADLVIADQQLKLSNSSATAAAGKPWEVAGTISFARRLDLKLTRADGEAQQISGPLPPVVVPIERASK